jgi:hypothetical protein
MDLESFRQQLIIWGITPNVLIAIGIASLVTLFFSLRIVIKWFLGLQHLQDELAAVRKQLVEIQMQLSLPNAPLKKEIADEEDNHHPPIKKSSESFRLTNH